MMAVVKLRPNEHTGLVCGIVCHRKAYIYVGRFLMENYRDLQVFENKSMVNFSNYAMLINGYQFVWSIILRGN